MADVPERVREFIEKRFRKELAGRAVTPDTPLFSDGIVDSFGVLELIAFLEDAFSIDIDTGRHDIADFDSITKISAIVTAARP